MNLQEILFEIIKEAEQAKVTLGSDEFYIGFNTIINDKQITFNKNNNITLRINDIEATLLKLNEYINEEIKESRKSLKYLNSKKDYIKFLIMYLFVNATTEDFINFEEYIDKYINYLKDKTLENLNKNIAFPSESIFKNDILNIKNTKQSIMMETPNKIEFSFTNKLDDTLKFLLPEISYGINIENGKKVCYIYSILNKENVNNEATIESLKYKKSISRKLYKLNKGISDYESQEFKDYLNEETAYYPENITDVSVSSVLSLYLFLNLIKDKVDIIKGIPYLPIRYISREYASMTISDTFKKKELEKRNEIIQKNLTEKFIRTFRRVEKYIPNFFIDSYPYEYDEYINCSFSKDKKEIIENEIITSFNMTK